MENSHLFISSNKYKWWKGWTRHLIVRIHILERCFSNFNKHTNHLEILLKIKLWFSWSGWGLTFSGDDKAWDFTDQTWKCKHWEFLTTMIWKTSLLELSCTLGKYKSVHIINRFLSEVKRYSKANFWDVENIANYLSHSTLENAVHQWCWCRWQKENLTLLKLNRDFSGPLSYLIFYAYSVLTLE